MRISSKGGVQLETQSFGSSEDPTLILIMGATASMMIWPDDLCLGLAEGGLHVVRFDHRDTGRSTSVPLGLTTYPLIAGALSDWVMRRQLLDAIAATAVPALALSCLCAVRSFFTARREQGLGRSLD